METLQVDWQIEVMLPLTRRVHRLTGKYEEYKRRIDTAAHPDEKHNLALTLDGIQEELALALLHHQQAKAFQCTVLVRIDRQ